jgi:hypothetical protein
MEIAGPDRLNVSSTISVTTKGLVKAESVPLPPEVLSNNSKLAGCKAISLKALLARTRPNLGNGVSGVLTAADGVSTDPIIFSELIQGYLVHSDATGAELPSALGGPIRAVFPDGVAIQSAVCGTPKPVSLKSLAMLTLHSEYELRELAAARELTRDGPRLVAELEEFHSASLFAFARVHGGVVLPSAVAVAGLDARGLTLRITVADGGGEQIEALAPFPRPISSASDVVPIAMEMHRAAFAQLDWRFKLHCRYYTEPVAVACRMALRSPANVAAATALLAGTAAAAVLLLRGRRAA